MSKRRSQNQGSNEPKAAPVRDNDWATAKARVARDYRPLVEAAKNAGWSVDSRNRRHVVLYPADVTLTAIPIPTTPSDHRSIKNSRAQLRRAGLEV